METPLLQTKLYIPSTRSSLVSRPRLIERLDAGLHRKLTLVCAPAGFGKTTLISEWISDSGLSPIAANPSHNAQPAIKTQVAWFSLDENDNDPARFLVYVIAALQNIHPMLGKGTLSALQSPQPPPTEAILTTLINKITTLPDQVVLVLDDYHLIETQIIHDTLTFLLQHLPSQLHLVIATREDPPLPLARLRARNQLTELRATDLRFTSSEAAAFLNQVMGLALCADDIAVLESRTEGWIAGLQLAALAMQGPLAMQSQDAVARGDTASRIQAFTGSHRFVLDYLIEEVLEQQPEDVQTFLLQTAILDRLTGDLCDTVRFGYAKTRGSSFGTAGQDHNGQTILEMLERANLFVIPLDEERRWYRYHHLFADLLRQRLHQTQPAQIPVLNLRASAWYEQNNYDAEAINYAMRAEDFDRAAHLIEEHADAMWRRGEHVKLGRWLYELPVELVLSKPQLSIFSAWYLFATGQTDQAEGALKVAERVLDSVSEPDSPVQNSRPGLGSRTLHGRIAAIRALMGTWVWDESQILEHADKALAYLPQKDPLRCPAAITMGDGYFLYGDMSAAAKAQTEAAESCRAVDDHFFYLIANLKLAFTLRAQGRLQQTLELCRQQIQYAADWGLSHTVVTGCLWAMWGETLAELNILDEALQHTHRGVELATGGDLALLGFSYLCLIKALSCAGDTAELDKTIQKLAELARQHNLPPIVTSPLAAWQGGRLLAQGKLGAALVWAEEQQLAAEGEVPFVRKAEHTVFARILIVQGQLETSVKLLSRLLDATETRGRTSEMIEILILQALAFQVGNNIDQAIMTLERALALAEPGGFVRVFVNEGPLMAHLLHKMLSRAEALSRSVAPDYIRRLLAAFPDVEPEQTTSMESAPSNATLIEPLSQRELEVLALIAEGLTNPEIAAKLYLALNTVKVHTRNIYGKLGVHNRTQATKRAQTLNLLPRK